MVRDGHDAGGGTWPDAEPPRADVERERSHHEDQDPLDEVIVHRMGVRAHDDDEDSECVQHRGDQGRHEHDEPGPRARREVAAGPAMAGQCEIRLYMD